MYIYIVCVDGCSLVVIEEPNGYYSIDDRAHQDKTRENSLFWVSINSRFKIKCSAIKTITYHSQSPHQMSVGWLARILLLAIPPTMGTNR